MTSITITTLAWKVALIQINGYMKNLSLLTLFLGLFFAALSQHEASSFAISIEEKSWENLPALQSFVWAKTSNAKWLFIGGRTDGLHKRRPFEAFLEADNNKMIYLYDPANDAVQSAGLSSLPTELNEQLQSTNMEFVQVDSLLYIVGGYGYSATSRDHITYDRMVIVNVDSLANAVTKGEPIRSLFQSISDSTFEVTGGQLGYLDGYFYLAGGQKFVGRYNPMGPNHGPGFVQEYTESIRKFRIDHNTGVPVMKDLTTWRDRDNLHRRDYNMKPQIFSDGSKGFTMFTGVFQFDDDIPWLTTVDINSSGHSHRADFKQYLSHYHGASVPIYEQSNNAMHTLFFGGMAQFKVGKDGKLVEDRRVPFVKTISKVVRYADDSMEEITYTDTMPGFLGSSSEFIPVSQYYNENDILLLDQLPSDKTLIGYIVGGIESTVENEFFNNASLSDASKRVFAVFLDKSISGNEELISANHLFELEVNPNPSKGKITINYTVPRNGQYTLRVFNSAGAVFFHKANISRGKQQLRVDLGEIPNGVYFVELNNGEEKLSKKIIIK